MSTDLAVTVSAHPAGNLFHSLIVLGKNEYWKMFILALGILNLNWGLPRVLFSLFGLRYSPQLPSR